MSNRRTTSLFATAIIAVVGVAAAAYQWRNPERQPLDDAARAAAGGSYLNGPAGVTHYELAGPDSGRTVVLIHGRSVPYYIWDSTVVALSGAGYRVLRYDLLGRGFSDRPRVSYTPDLLDQQLVALLDSLGIRGPVDVAGLSMGGMVAGTFVDRHPDRVRTLTLVDPVAGRRPAPPKLLPIPMLRDAWWQVTQVPKMAEGQATDFAEPQRWPDWEARYRVQMRYRGFGRAMLSTAVENAKVDRDSVYASGARHRIPTLLIWGTEDRTVPFAMSANVRRAIPHAEFVPIPGAGHLPHMERSQATHSAWRAFLSRTAAP